MNLFKDPEKIFAVVREDYDPEDDEIKVRILFSGTHNRCFLWLLNNQKHSVEYAIKHDRYKIVRDKRSIT